mmetsp:Transcript_2997/g.9166  ORF Transcript_2997/g.9166 Transcript_2997/m.9166 type:complete len:304 (+) Transcript_2997:1094-2005(+)
MPRPGPGPRQRRRVPGGQFRGRGPARLPRLPRRGPAAGPGLQRPGVGLCAPAVAQRPAPGGSRGLGRGPRAVRPRGALAPGLRHAGPRGQGRCRRAGAAARHPAEQRRCAPRLQRGRAGGGIERRAPRPRDDEREAPGRRCHAARELQPPHGAPGAAPGLPRRPAGCAGAGAPGGGLGPLCRGRGGAVPLAPAAGAPGPPQPRGGAEAAGPGEARALGRAGQGLGAGRGRRSLRRRRGSRGAQVLPVTGLAACPILRARLRNPRRQRLAPHVPAIAAPCRGSHPTICAGGAHSDAREERPEKY